MMLKLAKTFREVLKTAWLVQTDRTKAVQNSFLELELYVGLTKNLSSWFEKVSSEVSVVVTPSCWDCSWFAAFLLAVAWTPSGTLTGGKCGCPVTVGCRKPALLCSLLVFAN